MPLAGWRGAESLPVGDLRRSGSKRPTRLSRNPRFLETASPAGKDPDIATQKSSVEITRRCFCLYMAVMFVAQWGSTACSCVADLAVSRIRGIRERRGLLCAAARGRDAVPVPCQGLRGPGPRKGHSPLNPYFRPYFRKPLMICSSASASVRPRVISLMICSPAILPIAAS